MTSTAHATNAKALLEKLHVLLVEHGETNWVRGVSAAQSELASGSDDGFENARSIYRTMVGNGRGLSEYFFWDEDEKRRIAVNKELDEVRNDLWEIFDL